MGSEVDVFDVMYRRFENLESVRNERNRTESNKI